MKNIQINLQFIKNLLIKSLSSFFAVEIEFEGQDEAKPHRYEILKIIGHKKSKNESPLKRRFGRLIEEFMLIVICNDQKVKFHSFQRKYLETTKNFNLSIEFEPKNVMNELNTLKFAKELQNKKLVHIDNFIVDDKEGLKIEHSIKIESEFEIPYNLCNIGLFNQYSEYLNEISEKLEDFKNKIK